MRLSKIVDKKIPFTKNGEEGMRVGYWCTKCKKAIPIHGSKEVSSGNDVGNFSTIIHDKCGTSVESIWDDINNKLPDSYN